mmetsp:Transcript_39516/g.29186  ORF Transcript_39516/g.29186 Transcript_39516/m.29186 type:complete len:209 (-) Transcript_39516:772-1398(-)
MQGLHIINTTDNIKDDLEVLYDRLEDEETNSIFQHGVIKALIEVKWPIVMNRILLLQLLPYTLFMILLFVYTIKDYNSYETVFGLEEKGVRAAQALRILILIFVGYFFLLEAIQASQNIKKYFMTLWNYLDLSGFAILILAEVAAYVNRRDDFLSVRPSPSNEELVDMRLQDYRIRLLYATSILILWNRFLYYFRIFRSMGYYIRMLT